MGLSLENAIPDGDGVPEIEITGEMLEAGSNRLDDLIEAGSGLTCSPTYAAEEVYLAMERARLADRRQFAR